MPKATILGISGSSCSGKTTLARLLHSIFPHTLILHEDDFYRPEEQLPFRAGLRDWDCAAALDIPALVNALNFIRENGRLPEWLASKEDRNTVREHNVPDRVIEQCKINVDAWVQRGGKNALSAERKMVIVDGFLLFGESVREIRESIDLKIMLRAKFAKAKERREDRTGYVTLEGFWEDPPGYVEKVVWPGYVEDHGFMFKGGDVDGEIDEQVMQKLGIHVCPGEGELPIRGVLQWAVDNVMETLGLENS